ncbi:methyltransferase family protein [Geothermobacter ehrlichii]|uniref:Methyltransferase family protein n=1 Tax=Geothermobacter ehrlichii TaxID=213224 RepID=A0A5D3WLY5_9BACT|nr:methyltransferase domain-containing protein [Geothermobacter ehrlichii]TYP00176.1 methyltransferase family protein [Geothermobacter ehrlichii]
MEAGADSAPLNFRLDWGVHTIFRLLSSYRFQTVLDIGSGSGEHKRFFEYFGKQVYSVDLFHQADYCGDFLEIDFDRRFDVIWCSHVLEHQRNVGLFLDKVFSLLPERGILALTVPYHPRERLISGHINNFSIPLLCYHLIMAGFDCSKAQILGTFETSLIVRKKEAIHPERGKSSAHGADAGYEFAGIQDYFPFPATQGREITEAMFNWGDPGCYILPRPAIQVPANIESKNLQTYPQFCPQLRFADG